MNSTSARQGRYALLLLTALALAGCGGAGGGGGPGVSGDLVLLEASVEGQSDVPLNTVITLEFSNEVLESSVTPETVRIRRGPGGAVQAPGTYAVDGNRVFFYPRIPTSADLGDAGLAPGREHSLLIPGGTAPNAIRGETGEPLRETYEVRFATAGAASPGLFIDQHFAEDPQVSGMTPEPGAADVPRDTPIEIVFSEPLLPVTVTSEHIRLIMVERPAGVPLATGRPITGALELTQSHESACVTFRPDFPLADDAKYAVEVDRRVTDLVGNELVPFQAGFTLRDELPVPDDLTLTFGPGTEVLRDGEATTASWNEDREGAVQAVYSFGGGDGTDGALEPTENVTLVSDAANEGLFQFRSVDIPAGVTVRVIGDVPVTIRSLRAMRIAGTLDASGAKGDDSEPTSTTVGIPATLGGEGGPGGGRGGDVFTNVPTKRDSNYAGNVGENGQDGFGAPGTGGGAATWGSRYRYKSGAGGGGGGHANLGEQGGASTNTSSIRRGVPGFAGGPGGNDLLSPLTGGGGGGAGMNGWYYWTPRSHGAGAGGGGGGGLALECAQDIDITGEVLADGGDGGQVVMGLNNYSSAGGGAGAGGAVVARATGDVRFDGAHVSARGGQGGSGGLRYGGSGGGGSDGRIRLEDADGAVDVTGSAVLPSPEPNGLFAPTTGPATVALTVWLYPGVFDPVFSTPVGDDLVSTTPLPGQTVTVEVQMAREDPIELGQPDEATASDWTDISDIETLNGRGYGFIRVRVSFALATGQKRDDPLPYLSRVRLRYVY